ncbi:GRASP55/65 family protein [Hortaea werneckii]|uniref:PDZ GRASP-type domain-containing protein n=1 Tax=Hortaea werneckii TaxID=91943 RepID=A0A3M7AC28_HORWE|nr:GRASP55/65 family protein [Hortaea werneckii]KAI7704200.1 GRASP55/65 family protein [Hortaea werneckii]RMY25033.1 hypothetical protein D0865_16352 [Hortaea werneckii]
MANLFGTLNRFIARLDSSPADAQNPASRASTQGFGFQVLRNTNTGLALDPWFDFIIGINGRNLDNGDPNLFATEIRNCAGATISLGVWSAKGQAIREMYVTVPQSGESLGLALQWCPLNITEDVWHILDVMPNSPADVAGLLPYSDYVIGSPDGNLRGDAGLGGLVEQFMDAPLRLYVYNQEYDVTRVVTITASRSWGGEGALGCVLGYGALHRVPAPLTEPAQGPGETLFEAGAEQTYQPTSMAQAGTPQAGTPEPANFMVPASMPVGAPPTGGAGESAATAPPPAGGPPPGRAKKQRTHHAPVAGLDDYFKEGEQKSREMEGGSSTPKPNAGLPPPPKAGGPPKAASPAPAAEESEASKS